MELAKLNITGIKCDNPLCDYQDNTVEIKDYDEWLNKPCPKCGDNLLTEKDLNLVKAMTAGCEALNKLFGEVPDHLPQLRFDLEMNGTGTVLPKPRL